MTESRENLDKLLGFDYYDPFEILGIHEAEVSGKLVMVIRAVNPSAAKMWVVEKSGKEKKETIMEKIHLDGFFELVFPGRKKAFSYQLKVEFFNGHILTYEDPYRFSPFLTDFDLHLFSQGQHQQAYEKLGAHIMKMEGVTGTHFAVWAPNARAVAIVGDFNSWDNRRYPMRVLGQSGVWEIFIPGITEGEIYKFMIKTQQNHILEKADPYAFATELRPKTGSVVWDIEKYKWKDTKWMNKRAKSQNLDKPISIYEVHLGSWRKRAEEGNRYLTYKELAHELTEYVKYMNYTHVELMPVAEHPFDGSWGYQVTGYFAPTSRFGNPDEFKYFVDYLHKHDIGILVDWVPGHFPKDAHGLAYFDGTALYEHEDPRKGEHMDWGTLIFNFGRNEVKNFLISNALFWLGQFHIDGLRVDAVASMLYLDYSREPGEWVPNEFGGRENLEAIDFMKQMNELVFSLYPGVMTAAEESTAFGGVSRPTYVGGLGFEFKWNMGWMNDTLEYFSKEAIHRKYHQGELTFSLIYAFSENFTLVLSHDEVVHGKNSIINKMPGDTWQKFANVRLLYTYMWAHPGKKLLFQGQDFGQWDEWNEEHSIDWHLCEYEPHWKLQKMLSDLNGIYKNEPALYEVDFEPYGFEWIDFYDSDNSIISFIRRAKNGEFVVVVLNFTPVARENYRVGVLFEGFYKEIFNSDSSDYWGGNVGNNGGVWADSQAWQGKSHSINITVPPLAGLILRLEKKSGEA